MFDFSNFSTPSKTLSPFGQDKILLEHEAGYAIVSHELFSDEGLKSFVLSSNFSASFRLFSRNFGLGISWQSIKSTVFLERKERRKEGRKEGRTDGRKEGWTGDPSVVFIRTKQAFVRLPVIMFQFKRNRNS